MDPIGIQNHKGEKMMHLNAKPLLLSLFFFLAAPLLAIPLAHGAVPPGRVTFSSDVVEERVDCLITYLKQENKAQIPDDFKTASGLKSVLGQIGEKGLRVEAKTSELALNKATKEILNRLLDQLADDSPYQPILFAMLENIDKLPEGFCGPEAYESNRDLSLNGRDLYDNRDHYKRPPTETGNFIYYGKLYTLPDEAKVAQNGILFMSDDPLNYTGSGPEDISSWVTYPPFIAPLWIISDDQSSSAESNGGVSSSSVEQVFDPPVVTGTQDFFRYAYNTGTEAPTAPFSATLYMNPASQKSDWILFSYGDVELPYEVYKAFVGLVPGDGSPNHPGPGVARGSASVDLSEQSGLGIYGDTQDYLSIFQMFPADTSDGDASGFNTNFDLADHFLIFRPDGDNKYTVTAGTRKMVVDSLGLDGQQTSLDMAIINLRDPDLLARVDGGEFVPGLYYWQTPAPNAQFPGIENWPILWGDKDNANYYYRYGLQTVGQNSEWGPPQLFGDSLANPDDTLNKINGNGLLAYAVQVEEDRVNEKIIEMARDADKLKIELENLKNQLQCGDIRARDALFTQQADAQSGRVTKDHNGYWVRAQQYILRPDNKTVQVLNVALRGQDAGNLAGLSTMDFTTSFSTAYSGDLRNLPWNQWLATSSYEDGTRGVWTTSSAPRLDNMYVKFTNPSGEYLKEARAFTTIEDLSFQPIGSEDLSLYSLAGGLQQYTYSKDAGGSGSYGITAQSNGFAYEFGDSEIKVAFYKADDSGDNDAVDVSGNEVPKDMWDALRVNEVWWSGAPQIGNNNLEIAIDQDSRFFQKPIDVVYIPMSRMLWKNSPD
jgi:uncharacterized protein YlzI (FlbEa/FlbD family)